MKKILVLGLMMLLLAGNVWAQPTPPATPPSPESQGIQIPQVSSGTQAPPSSESNQALIPASAASARSAAPASQQAPAPYGAGTSSYGGTAPSYQTRATSGTYESTYMVIPPGVSAPNRFYIPYFPSTVAGCNLGQWLPMWLDIRGSGPLYVYEWYPGGRLVSNYLAFIRYPGWQKMWFNGDTTGWHILQYYCNDWSNYIYVYVYGQYPRDYRPGLYPQPTYPTVPQTPEPGCNAQITITSSYRSGYSVYVDDNYIGGDGRRGDHLDGAYTFTVSGNQPHNIRISSNGFNYIQTNTYRCGRTYNIYI